MTIYLQRVSAYDSPVVAAIHASNPLDVFAIVRRERRDNFVITPYFTATIRNPGIGGIAAMPGEYWVWTERDAPDGELVEISRGRLMALPTELAAETCDIEFVCLPPDDEDVIKTAANALRVAEIDYDPDAPEEDRAAAEMYDPLFFDTDAADDPTNVMLARRNLWRWNHKHPLGVSIIDLMEGAVEHTVNLALHKSVTSRVINPPKNTSKLRIIPAWTQRASGKQTMNRTGQFSTFSYQDILSQIPKAGDPIGADTGWLFHSFEVYDTPGAVDTRIQVNSSEYGAAAGGYLVIRPHVIDYDYRASYDYQQAREEYIDIVMPVARQNVLGDLQTEAVETLTLGQLNVDLTTPEWEYEDPETLEVRHYEVGDRVQANGRCYVCLVEHDAQEPFRAYDQADEGVQLWDVTEKIAAIRDLRTPGFANLARGVRVIRHGIRRLDRIVAARSLANEVSFEMPADGAKNITCADSIRLEYSRLIGGECVGVVSSIEYRADGPTRIARVTILCSIGDGSDPAVPGEDQFAAGGVVYGVSYGRLSTPVNAYALESLGPYVDEAYFDGDEQLSAALSAASAGLDPIAAINERATELHIGFPPLREEDLLRRRVTVTCEPVWVPKGIDISPTV